MQRRAVVDTAARKEPQQERSRRMRGRILEAAVRVLREEGALGLTTTRVADAAGISVGSLYQYFPNKHAIVVALHDQAVRSEWVQTQALLADPSRSPRQKLYEIAEWFLAFQSDEAAELGSAFEDVDVFLRERVAVDVAETAESVFADFVADATARSATSKRTTSDTVLMLTILKAVGKEAAARRLSRPDQQRWARATVDMLCHHLGIP